MPAVGQRLGLRIPQQGLGEIRRYRRGLHRWGQSRQGQAPRMRGRGRHKSPGQGLRTPQLGHRSCQRPHQQTQIQAEGWRGWRLQHSDNQFRVWPERRVHFQPVSDQAGQGSPGLGLGIWAGQCGPWLDGPHCLTISHLTAYLSEMRPCRAEVRQWGRCRWWREWPRLPGWWRLWDRPLA